MDEVIAHNQKLLQVPSRSLSVEAFLESCPLSGGRSVAGLTEGGMEGTQVQRSLESALDEERNHSFQVELENRDLKRESPTRETASATSLFASQEGE